MAEMEVATLRKIIGPDRSLRNAILHLDHMQEPVCAMILETPAPGKHAARSAIRHILMAWEIRELDPEMAAFHAITAEEEAATAIFHALRRRRYSGSPRLNPHDHVQKAATRPFFMSVAKVLRMLPENGYPTKLVLDERGPRREFSVRLVKGGHWFWPAPPLNFTIGIEDKVHDFAQEIVALANASHAKSVERYIKDLANRRNRALYAAPNGLPVVQDDVEDGILNTRDWVFWYLIVYLMIDRYREHQLFVQQCLDAYLALLARIGKRSA